MTLHECFDALESRTLLFRDPLETPVRMPLGGLEAKQSMKAQSHWWKVHGRVVSL